jgi:N-acyl-D-aspartate/D-glutamate deacylase
VVAVSRDALTPGPSTRVVDAAGQWVMPGFVDAHTHYDAELQVAPGLNESVRHGVTTVLVGNCSLSTVYSTPLDIADLFSRVEALPRTHVLGALEDAKTWSTPAGWVEHLERLPLGPHVASFLGHSDVRASVMGMGRSTDPAQKATRREQQEIERRLEDALDVGFLGISTMTNPWDKLDGDRYRSRSLPSTYSSWKEFRGLSRVLRRRGRVLQGVPNLNKKYDIAFYLTTAMGLFRKPLKVSLLAAADTKAEPWVQRIFAPLAFIANRIGRGQFTWQHLPTTFRVWADGIDLVVFEEFGSGRQVARDRGIHAVDCYLDLVVEHGTRLRWKTNIANTRPEIQDRLINRPGITIGFSDAGAHLRNMAFYNFGIRLLNRVHQAQAKAQSKPFMSVEKAVYKLTGELGDFYGIDAGHLAVGDRADVVVVDPAGLSDEVDGYHEALMPEFGDMSRMVNRNDAAVTATIVSGELVFERGTFVEGYGRTIGTGRFLRAGEARGTVAPVRRPEPVVAQ